MDCMDGILVSGQLSPLPSPFSLGEGKVSTGFNLM